MFDYTLPVAKRTRLRVAQVYKDYYEKKKEAERIKSSVVDKADKPVQVSESDKGLRSSRSDYNVDSAFGGVSHRIVVDDDVVLVEREGGNIGDLGGFEGLGVKDKGKEKLGAKGINDRVQNVVDDLDSEDDDVYLGEKGDVVCLGEKDDVVSLGEGCSFGAKKGENVVFIDVDSDESLSKGQLGETDDALSDRELAKSDGRKRIRGGQVLESNFMNESDESDFDDISMDDSYSLEAMSSEEDNDDPEDEDFDVKESENSGSSEGWSSDNGLEEEKGNEAQEIKVTERRSKGEKESRAEVGEEEEEVKDAQESSVRERRRSKGEKESRAEVGVKRKTDFGLDIFSSSDIDKYDIDNANCVSGSSEINSVAKHARSPFNSESGEKKMKLATMNHPLHADEEELESLPGHNVNDVDSTDTEAYSSVKETMFGTRKIGFKEGNENEGESRKHTKRRCRRASKNHDYIKILADSILGRGELTQKDEVIKEERSQRVILPLKFTFGVEEIIPPEKSELEKELDNLWVEMEFALRSCEIGFTDPAKQMRDEDNVSPEVDIHTLCRQGNHELMLNEEIGLVCKFCSYVDTEIRYIVPSFDTHPRGISDRRYYCRVDSSIFNDLQNQESGCESHSGSDRSTRPQGTVWEVIPYIKNSLYPHQREGLEFIWKNIAGDIYIDKLKDPTRPYDGSGCIISHAPGTGKTRLTIVFLQTYLKLFPTCRPVIIAPRSMLLTWEEEFRKWKADIPFHILNTTKLSGKESMAAVNLLNRVKAGEQKQNFIRMVKLYSWKNDESILGISYRLFEELAGEGKTNARGKIVDQFRKILLELPGLCVFDEGHTARNDQSRLWKVLTKIKSERRIILSGTPFQNNFDELFNTLCLVRPKFVDSISPRNHGCLYKKRGRKRNNEARGKWSSLTSSFGKIAGDRLKSVKELKDMIAPFVHVHKGNVLQQTLPGLRHYVVVLRPSPLQKSLLRWCKNKVRKNVFDSDYFVSSVSNHPSLLPKDSLEKEESLFDRDDLEGLRLDPGAGVKTKFLMELVRLSDAMNDKVLVFGQYIEPLACIKDQLKDQFNWTEGRQVLYMDGKLEPRQRQSSINVFNDPASEAKVLLASTKACSEGINLVGGSRVVLLDVVWNPSVARQAISRAYRIGQKKVVYVYHLITSGTIEEEKCCTQAQKDQWSELLFPSSNKSGNWQKITSAVSEDQVLEEMVQHDKLKHMFRKILNQPKDGDVIQAFGSTGL
ncbi:SNF2_N domain-containing protein/Helicase_C domain-containing protein [Cephalotus follicularis]|uniref:SNF2_N domain-containing protein/Helicase_C domain-containing protein n=1 Tax=Cephalotus follicularis TaxID=3775 RepID=A0A1Q3CYG6_CEPFO|nr:SNF2_N domain-containing protein/Helicase_C domain-containing protein [Cephalotus follicularis]